MAWGNFDSTYQSFPHKRAAARVAGTPEVVGATIAIPLTNAKANEDCTMVYCAHEVVADKKAGAAIDAGDTVRMYTPAHATAADRGLVNKAAAAATNVIVGFAREAADSAATKIKIYFFGGEQEARKSA